MGEMLGALGAVAVAGLAMVLIGAGEIWTNPIIVGAIVGLPASILGFMAYRRSARLDKVAEQAALLQTQGAAAQRVLDGLNQIVTNLQEDNRILREQAVELSRRITLLGEQNRDCLQRIDALSEP